MGKLFIIMGKSSTGKDTVYNRLLEVKELRLSPIVPYTTRPIRAREKEGVEYHFTDEAGLLALQQAGKVIELREYHTVHGIWKYFTVDDGHIELDRRNYLMIGTLEAYKAVRAYFGQDKVVPILIALDDGVRLQRALNREKKQEDPKYQEMCRRYLADAEDFAEDKIRAAGITRSFYNGNLRRCLAAIEKYIRKESGSKK